MKRVFLIVLDSFGVGALPDAKSFGDENANTLKSIAKTGTLNIPNMTELGLGNIDGVTAINGTESPKGVYAKIRELSNGKDTTTGHWEIAGIVSEKPMPTYPDGFPQSLLDEFSKKVGRGVLCNKPYSGTDVIRDYGQQHLDTGDLIVYTSADSVFQVAAHEELVSLDELYDICRAAREILKGEHGVGRVIARPFITENGEFKRTANRRDFSLVPPKGTMNDILKDAGLDVIGVGKINDIFAGQGITETHPTHSNNEGMEVTLKLQQKDFNGLCFVNLVDFDMLYGHRQDALGYANAINEFDAFLNDFMPNMRENDLLIITADHGCDPSDNSTDHTREYIPFLMYKKGITPNNLNTIDGFSFIAKTVTDYLLNKQRFFMTNEIIKSLIDSAIAAKSKSYSPYSDFKVGAALLTKNGKVYTGANIESVSFTPTICAERVAFFTAVHNGEKEFSAIAVVGSKANEDISSFCPPCGVCRQVMAEFCDSDFTVILYDGKTAKTYTLGELMPASFDKNNLK